MGYSWATFSGRFFDQAQFAVYAASLKYGPAFRPIGATIHNTGGPNLKQWVELGSGHASRIANLEAYYKGLGWHAGPHLFISRSHVTEFTSLVADGIHASCFNKTRLGFEMTGDFSTESFTDGDGAMVRDMAAFATATMLGVLGLPATYHPDGTGTVNFHTDCPADHHACPGKHVDHADFVARVAERMAA